MMAALGLEEVRGCSFSMASESLPEKMHLSPDLEDVREKPRGYLGKDVPGRENRRYKVPEAGSCLVCLGNMEEASVAGAE